MLIGMEKFGYNEDSTVVLIDDEKRDSGNVL